MANENHNPISLFNNEYMEAVKSIAEEAVNDCELHEMQEYITNSTRWSSWSIHRWSAQLVYFFSPGKASYYDGIVQSRINEGDSVYDAVSDAAAETMKRDVLEMLRIWADHDDDGQFGYNLPGKGFVPVNS